MLVQEFIKEHTNYKELLESDPYNLKITEDEFHVLLKYNQIKSDFNNPIVRECRGLILYKDTFEVACRPFEKFGNFGESYVPEIDWNSAKVQEKLDGTLIKIWFSKPQGLWIVSTNGTIEAENADLYEYDALLKNFGDLFWYTLEEKMKVDADNLFQKIFDKNKTYLFELCTPLNRVVVPHTEYKLFYIVTKDNETGEESIEDLPLPRPKEYPLSSLDECITAAKALPYSEEGYVVVDKYLNRLKIKSPSYVHAHHVRGEGVLTLKGILTLLRDGEVQEYLSYYADKKDEFDKVIAVIHKINDAVTLDNEKVAKQSFYSTDMSADQKKQAAMFINKHCKYPSGCFAFVNQGKVPGEWLGELRLSNLVAIVRKELMLDERG